VTKLLTRGCCKICVFNRGKNKRRSLLSKTVAACNKNNILQNFSYFLNCGKDFLPVYLLLMLSSAPNISEIREYFELWGKKKPSPKLFSFF